MSRRTIAQRAIAWAVRFQRRTSSVRPRINRACLPSSRSAAATPQFTLGDKFRRTRRDRGVNQAEFAATLGVAPKRYASWESDSSTPGKDLIAIARRIELAFGVPAAWTLGLNDNTPAGPGGPDGGISAEYAIRDSNPEPAD